MVGVYVFHVFLVIIGIDNYHVIFLSPVLRFIPRIGICVSIYIFRDDVAV